MAQGGRSIASWHADERQGILNTKDALKLAAIGEDCLEMCRFSTEK
jgi:hypothetical protein